MIFLVIYLLIASFTIGCFTGEISGAKVRFCPREWLGLFLLSMVWPLVVYMYLTEPKG